MAVKENDVNKAKDAIKKGANINGRLGESGQTPLMMGCLSGSTEIVRMLLEV